MLKRTLAFLLASVFSLALFGCVSFGGKPEPTDTAVEVLFTDALTQVPTAEPTLAPTPTPSPAPTPEPTLAPWELPAEAYKCRANKVNIRTEANTQSDIVASVGFEDEVAVIGSEGDFYMICFDNEIRYCYSAYFVPADEKLYGYMPAWSEYKTDSDGNIVYESDGVTPVVLTSELIDIRLLMPELYIYQIFGAEENFTGRQLYARSVPVMQTGMALKFVEAAEEFAKDGYSIKLYDCYRPKSVQYILYDIIQDSRYIADPYKSASNHNRAAAVDITLLDAEGNELDFPTPMHTFGYIVHRDHDYMWTQEQRNNVNYMTEVMLRHGFKSITTEWWHFSDTDYPGYIVMDIDMRDIPMYTAAEIYELTGGRFGTPSAEN